MAALAEAKFFRTLRRVGIPLFLMTVLAACGVPEASAPPSAPGVNCTPNPQPGFIVSPGDPRFLLTNESVIDNALSCVVSGDYQGKLATAQIDGLKTTIKKNDDGSFQVSFKITDGSIQTFDITLSASNCVDSTCANGTADYRLGVDKTGPQIDVLSTGVDAGAIVEQLALTDPAGLAPELQAGLLDAPSETFTVSSDGQALLTIQATGKPGEKTIVVVAEDALGNSATTSNTAVYNPFSGISATASLNIETGQVNGIISYGDQATSIDSSRTTINAEQETLGFFGWPAKCEGTPEANQSYLSFTCRPNSSKDGTFTLHITTYDVHGNKITTVIQADGLADIPDWKQYGVWAIGTAILSGLGVTAEKKVRKGVEKEFYRILNTGSFDDAIKYVESNRILRVPHREKKLKLIEDLRRIETAHHDIASNNLHAAYTKIIELYAQEPDEYAVGGRNRLLETWMARLAVTVQKEGMGNLSWLLSDVMNKNKDIPMNWFFNFFEENEKILQKIRRTRNSLPSKIISPTLDANLSAQETIRAMYVRFGTLRAQTFTKREQYNEWLEWFTSFKNPEYLRLVVGDLISLGRLNNAQILVLRFSSNQSFASVVQNATKQVDDAIRQVGEQLDQDFEKVANRKYSSIDQFNAQYQRFRTAAIHGSYWNTDFDRKYQEKARKLEDRIKKEGVFRKVVGQLKTAMLKEWGGIPYLDISTAVAMEPVVGHLLGDSNTNFQRDTMNSENIQWFDHYIENCPAENAEKFLQTLILIRLIPDALFFGNTDFDSHTLLAGSISFNKTVMREMLTHFSDYITRRENIPQDKIMILDLMYYRLNKIKEGGTSLTLHDSEAEWSNNAATCLEMDALNVGCTAAFMRFAEAVGFTPDMKNQNDDRLLQFYCKP